ncbi:MAG: protein kinase, partial [Pirellulales bacterium]
MTADRRFDPEETDSAADDALIAALALYDETRDTGAASDLGDTGPPDPELQGRFELLRGVLDDLARLREADPPRTAGIAEPAGSDSTATGAAPSPGIADDAPRIIGRFVIEEELGRGGHGIVFRAHDPALGRDVALKVPRPELLLSEAARKRFLREGRSTASLAHPNLVTVFEAGEAGPVCYLAQEYCAGPNLETWLGAQRRAVPSRRAAELVAQLAEGVEHAHRRGVVHRDLKPGNVLMQPVSGNVKGSRIESADLAVADARESWVPRIVDFGLARLEEGAGTLTATGALVGTPAYMAPEQLEASRGAVGPASDIYALGGILFQVLTGQTPFNGASQTELIKQILLDEPRRPRQVRRDLPADLEAICLRALEKRPADRYVSAGEMAADLRRFLRGEPTRARPLRANEKLVRWARHKPWAAALVVVVALSLFTMVAMAGAYTVQLRAALAETKQRRDEAENSRQIVRRQLYASDIRLAQEALDAYRLGECVSILDRQRPAPGDLDLREFAWGYLWHRTHSAQRELLGNEGEQYAVEYSPDGSLLVAAGADGVVRLWEADTGRLRQELRDSHSEVNALAFSADGSQLAAVNDAGELLIWSLAGSSSLKCRAAVSATELYAVRFSPDGQQTAVAGDDGYVRVVATLDGAIQRELPGHTQPVYALAYWQGGHHLISGGRQGQLLDWDLTNDADAQSRTWPIVGNGPIRSLEFTPDETHLAFCQDDVYIVRVGDDDAMNRISCDTAPFSSVRFSADGKWIVIGSMDSTWRMGPWNRKRDDLAVVAAHQGRVHAIAVSPLRDEVASVGADGFVRQWSNPWPSNQFTLTASGALRYTAEFSAHGERLILKYGEKDDSSNLVSSDWDGNAWQAVHYWKSSERNAAIRCAISSDGKWIVRTDGGANLLAWQRELSTEWRKIGSLEPLIGELALAPAAPLVIGSNMGTLAAWDLEPARLRWKVEIPRSDVRQLTSSERLVACSVGSEVRVYDLLTGKLLLSRQTPGSEIHALAIAVDSRQLLAAGTDRSIYRWTLPGGDKLPSWIAHGAIVEGLAIDASGRTVASFDSDSILKIWHPPTGQAILSLYAETPNRMVFSPDGRYLHLGGSASRDWGVWSLHSVLPTSVSGIAKQAASSRFPEVESVPPASVPDDAVASAEAAEESHPASIGDGLILDARTQAVALQSNGKIVAVGYSNNGRDDDFVIARFNANGSLDTLFS